MLRKIYSFSIWKARPSPFGRFMSASFSIPVTQISVLLCHGELIKSRFEDWSMGYSEINVLSFFYFLQEVSFGKKVEKASSMEAIYFLMVASV